MKKTIYYGEKKSDKTVVSKLNGNWQQTNVLLLALYNNYIFKKHPYIKRTARGVSVDIKYTLLFEKLKPLYNLVEMYPTKLKERRLRFHELKQDRWRIHKDRILGKPHHQAIIFPLINCDENTVTKWYDLIEGEQIEESYAYAIDENKPYKVRKLYETSFKNYEPVKIKVDVFHNVETKLKNKTRVIAGWYI